MGESLLLGVYRGGGFTGDITSTKPESNHIKH